MRKYPWDKWVERKRLITIRRGVDYKVRDYVMAQTIRNYASQHDLTSVVRMSKEGVIRFRFQDPDKE